VATGHQLKKSEAPVRLIWQVVASWRSGRRRRTRLSQRRAGRLIPVRLETLRYHSIRDRQDALRQRLRELAAARVRFVYRRLTVLLKREGWRVNAKRIYRLYGDEGLTVRTKPRKRLASRPGVPMPVATRPNER
jgi:putative transposase